MSSVVQTSVSEKPILFSGSMVRAILAGRKTQTRRVIVPKPKFRVVLSEQMDEERHAWFDADGIRPGTPIRCPFGSAGDRLWVRETWAPFHDAKLYTCVKYQADGAVMKPTTWTHDQGAWCEAQAEYDRWRPSIHLPRWACRLVLDVVSVRAARLREIDELEARAEGIESRELNRGAIVWSADWARQAHGYSTARNAFIALWDKLNASRGYGWDANPWVWIVEFRRATA